MHCHYCSRAADVVADSGGLEVGLCDRHLQERLEELAAAEPLGELEGMLDVESE